jgi:hypothetical protein
MSVTDVRKPTASSGALSERVGHAILQIGSRRWLMFTFTVTITAGMLLAFFWAFWVFAFGGWWCGGGC